jgi:hypothetical protein
MVLVMLWYRSSRHAHVVCIGIDTKVWPDTIVQLRGPLCSGRMTLEGLIRIVAAVNQLTGLKR